MLKSLTQKQITKLSFYKEKWLNKIFNYELYNLNTFESVKEKMVELYDLCNLKKPIVLFVDSPLACQFAVVFLKTMFQVGSQVGSQVRSQVGSQVGSQVESQVESQVGSQVRSQVGSQVRSQVESQVEYTSFSSYINYSDFGWLSFYDFFKNETAVLDIFKNVLEKIIFFVDSSFVSIQLENFCIVSKYPSFISRNSENELHNLSGYAISFDDGYGQHYINGRFLNAEIFQQIIEEKYSFEDFIKEPNEETKSTILSLIKEKFGDEKLFRFISSNLQEIDTFVDKKDEIYLQNTTKGMNIGVYTLFKGIINNNDLAFVRCYCPSTDRMFFLGVHPDNTNAKDAIASLYTCPKILINEIKSISRQGEKYCTTFTKKGLLLLSKATKEEIADLSAISGENYFKLIKYEY